MEQFIESFRQSLDRLDQANWTADVSSHCAPWPNRARAVQAFKGASQYFWPGEPHPGPLPADFQGESPVPGEAGSSKPQD